MGANAASARPHDARAMSDYEIAVCSPNSGESWDTFLAHQPGATFYHLFDWTRVNRAALGHESFYLVARRQESIAAVLPLTLVSGPWFGRILCSVPFVNYGGPCGEPVACDALMRAARALARERHVKYLELRCTSAFESDMHLSTRKVSMTIELDKNPDTLFNAFTSKHRTNIRRSYKNGLEVRSGGSDLLDVFYGVMEESWRRLGTPFYARTYFETILSTFPERTRIFVCARGDEPVAVAFNGYYNGVVEGMWAGGTDAARGLQANYALYWDMIKDACERGYSRYHLGRSTADSGAEDFKKKWNANTQQLYWYFDRPDGGAMPELNVNNPKYQAAIATWRRLPLFVTRLLGPRIARLIP